MKGPKSLRRLIFWRIVAAALVAALLVSGMMLAFFYAAAQGESSSALRQEAAYIARAVEASGMDYFTDLPRDADPRITWVAQDGTVLYDSQADPASLPNHGSREEIQEALADGTGDSFRYSSTLASQTMYYALRIGDGSVVRLATTRVTPLWVLCQAAVPLLLLLAVVVVCSVVLAKVTAKRIVEPINQIDLKTPQASRVYQELAPLTQRIEEQNRQIASQLEHLNEEHRKQDKFRRDFTANVSHELKTPLTSISGFAEIIRDGLVRPEDVTHFADNIYKEAQRLILLVGDIIKISRMDDASLPIQLEPIDLYDLCGQTLEHLRPAAEKMRLEVRLSGTREVINGAYQIAEEMIYNLCDNAIKYNRPGGLLAVRVEPRGDGCAVIVRDTGIGIPKEHQGRIFERFYRVDKNRSREIGGTGLGLSIVKHGAAYHAARLELDSAPGKGTTISILFPKARHGDTGQ